MRSPVVLLVQLGVVAAVAPAFFAAGRLLAPRTAFVVAFLFYWAAMLAAGAGLLVGSAARGSALGALFRRPRGRWVTALAFLPPAAVLAVVFVPVLDATRPALFLFVLGIALVNGFIEEIFWRGITAAEYRGAPAMLTASTAVFGAFHFLFLLVPLRYEGGAVNLVGGPLFMGAIWLFVTLRSRSVVPPILAHQLVNAAAFTGLGILNGWGS